MHLWRIATETRTYAANDLSGAGAAKYPGRWNASGEHVLYATQTLSLAVLETAAHLDALDLPLNKFVVQISVPASVWRRRTQLRANQLNSAWSAVPAGKASVDAGSQWYQAGDSALLLVPSVIVPEENVVLINATHPDARGMDASIVRVFDYNRLFRS
jgi:RES domain-containing protein